MRRARYETDRLSPSPFPPRFRNDRIATVQVGVTRLKERKKARRYCFNITWARVNGTRVRNVARIYEAKPSSTDRPIDRFSGEKKGGVTSLRGNLNFSRWTGQSRCQPGNKRRPTVKLVDERIRASFSPAGAISIPDRSAERSFIHPRAMSDPELYVRLRSHVDILLVFWTRKGRERRKNVVENSWDIGTVFSFDLGKSVSSEAWPSWNLRNWRLKFLGSLGYFKLITTVLFSNYFCTLLSFRFRDLTN